MTDAAYMDDLGSLSAMSDLVRREHRAGTRLAGGGRIVGATGGSSWADVARPRRAELSASRIRICFDLMPLVRQNGKRPVEHETSAYEPLP